LVLLVVALCASAITAFSGPEGFTCTRQDFADFQVQYNKHYTDADEEDRRFAIFCENAQRAHLKNQAVPRGSTAQFGITKFSDLTRDEFSRFLGYKQSSKSSQAEDGADRLSSAYAPPSTFDWRDHNPAVVTPVYNQGQCGSCWAFSATENIESQWALAGHTLTSLAVQQIVSCDTTDGGCNGGNTQTAYEYVIKAGGLDTWSSYPYTSGGGNTGRCAFKSGDIAAKIKGWEYAGKGNETAMVAYLATNGPISICVDASSWDSYRSGVMPASACGNSIDHCVLIVGYNLPQNYWIVRNSWATDWGIQGYIYLEYGHDTCSLATEPTNSLVN
jgi:C1A family cysteine protease